MSNPVFSVVVPAYNAESTLLDALDSIFEQQTEIPYEVVLVDDGSTDGTATIAKSYIGLRYIAKPNGGEASARNAGIRAAKSDIIVFLDADDKALPGRFMAQLPYMLDNPQVDVAFGDITVEGESESHIARYGLTGSSTAFTEVPDAIERFLAIGCFVTPSTVAVRRQTLLAAGGFNETRHYSCDYAMWLRVAARGGRFSFIDRPLSWYRTQLDTRLSYSPKTYLGFVQTMREALLEFGPLIDAAAYKQAFARYEQGVDALLRNDWAYGGRRRVMDRMEELAPLLPANLKRKYQAMSFIPSLFPRSARATLHMARSFRKQLTSAAAG